MTRATAVRDRLHTTSGGSCYFSSNRGRWLMARKFVMGRTLSPLPPQAAHPRVYLARRQHSRRPPCPETGSSIAGSMTARAIGFDKGRATPSTARCLGFRSTTLTRISVTPQAEAVGLGA